MFATKTISDDHALCLPVNFRSIHRLGTALRRAAMVAGLAALVASASRPSFASWPTYTVYKLAPGAYSNNVPYSINSYNRVVGETTNDAQNITTGMMSGPQLPTTTIPLQYPYDYLQLFSVNDFSTAVGRAHRGGYPQAITYRPGHGVHQFFATTSTQPGSQAAAINYNGVAIGHLIVIDTSGAGSEQHPMFSYDTKTNTVLGIWPNLAEGAINDDGVIAALPNPYTTDLPAGIVLTTAPGIGTTHNAPAGYYVTVPTSISTAGGVVVVGFGTKNTVNGSGTDRYGFMFNQYNGFWYSMPDPFGKNYETDPLAVDYWGQRAVGYTDDGAYHHYATVWENPGNHTTWTASPLHTVLGDPAGWEFAEASSISPLGAITGWGWYNGVESAFVAVPNDLFSFTASRTIIYGGQSMIGTVQTGEINPHPLTFDGLSSNTSVVQLPVHITKPAGSTPHNFTIKTNGVDQPIKVEMAVGLGGIRHTAWVTVYPALLYKLTVAPKEIYSGTTGAGTISLNGKAGPSGVTVQLSCPDGAVTVPTSAFIAPGASSATFPISVGPVRLPHSATISATLGRQIVYGSFTAG